MTDDTRSLRDEDPDGTERAELTRHLDALMQLPPKASPSIIVVGDDAVFGITPARREA